MDKEKDKVVAVQDVDGAVAPVDDTAAIAAENSMVVRFIEPYLFEGKTYTRIDLSGLSSLNGQDMVRAQHTIQTSGGAAAIMPEFDYGYCLSLAALGASLPYEFFTKLPGREAVKVKNAVSGFLFGED